MPGASCTARPQQYDSHPPMAKQGKANSSASSSPLFEAIAARDEKAVRKLLKTGATDWSAKDDQGRTPLEAARYYRSTEIEVMLLDAGAEPDKDDLNLYWAVSTRR